MRAVLAGTAVQMPGVGAEAARYNVALGYLEAFAAPRLPGVELSRVELPISLDLPSLPADAAERLLAGDPEVLGISSYCWDVDAWSDVLGEVRRRSPTTKVVLGGPTATFTGREILEASDLVDVAVLGEGEETLVDLLSRRMRDLDQVPGILFRDHGIVRGGTPRPPLDLREIASPYTGGVLAPPRHNLMLECSRGCFFRCKYCAWKNFLGALRHVPEVALERDLRWAVERGYGHTFILDSAINFDGDRLRTLASVMRSVGVPGNLRFSYFVSHEHLEDDHFAALAGVPTHEVFVGLESIEKSALRGIGRPPVDLEVFERKIGSLAQVGPIVVSIILGIPGDTLEGFKRTVDYLARLAESPAGRGIRAVRVFWMIVPPGTFFWENRARFGIRTAARGAPYLLASESFPEHDMAEAFLWLRAHPSAPLFLYEDASPARHLAGLGGLPDAPAPRGGAAPGAAVPALTAERALALVGRLAPGARLVGGWQVTGLVTSEGHPALRVVKDGHEVLVQIRPRTDGGPHFLRTRTTDLLWIRGEGAERATGSDDEKVVRTLAAEIARSEASVR